MRENAAVFDFELSPTDMASLDALTTPEALQEFPPGPRSTGGGVAAAPGGGVSP